VEAAANLFEGGGGGYFLRLPTRPMGVRPMTLLPEVLVF
jgi:hypothetical protein